MAADLEDRLTRMGDAVAPDDAATARARAAALGALLAARRRPAWSRLRPTRRTLSAAFAVAGTVAIAAVLVLSLPRGEDRPVAPGIALVATSPVPGATVSAEDLETTAQMIDRRAEIMGIDGADAEVVDGDIVLHLPPDAPPGTLGDLTARGELAMYDAAKVIVGSEDGTTSPPRPARGQRVVVQPVEGIPPARDSASYLLIRDEAALTNADIAEAANVDDPGGDTPVLRMQLTEEGRAAFHALTRSVAQRGAIENAPSTFLIVLDGELVSNPTIDPSAFPDGINSNALQVDTGPGVPEASRRTLAAKIQEGPLPVALAPAG